MNNTLICLDLEGTLISNAISQIPRPDLYAFLTKVAELGSLVLFTSVSPDRTKQIQQLLVAEHVVPAWFNDLQAIHPSGTKKPKSQAIEHAPAASHYYLIDDQSQCIEASENDWWIPIEEYLPPYRSDDQELLRVAEFTQQKLLREAKS